MSLLRRLFRTERLQEETELAVHILRHQAAEYYIDTEDTSLAVWALEDGRVLLRVPRFFGLTAYYYAWDDENGLLPLSMED
jgi:hypothetical protein